MNHILKKELFFIYSDNEFQQVYRGEKKKCLEYVNILNRNLRENYYILDKNMRRI